MATPPFTAGAATVSISPLPAHLEGRLYLGGYDGYMGRPAEGVHDDLYARALVLSQGSTTLALVALDLVGMGHGYIAAIQEAAARRLRIPKANVLVACTHTHASADLQGLWGGVSGDYASHVRRQAVRAIVRAGETARESVLRATSIDAGGRTKNRRGWPKTDDTLTVLQARDAEGRVIATLVNYAAHPTVLRQDNLLISRDFPGALVDSLERLLGGGVAIFVNADLGDVRPTASGDFAEMEAYGRGLAEVAADAIESGHRLEPPLALATHDLDVPVASPALRLPPDVLLRSFLVAVRGLNRAGALRWLADRYARRPRAVVFAGLGLIAEHPTFVRRRSLYLRTGVSRLRIGEGLDALAVPGEVLSRLGVSLRSRLQAPASMLLGLSNDTLGYFVPEDEWMTGRNDNYEESVSLGPKAAPALLAAAEALLAPDRGELDDSR